MTWYDVCLTISAMGGGGGSVLPACQAPSYMLHGRGAGEGEVRGEGGGGDASPASICLLILGEM